MLFACEHLYHANWVRSFDNIRLALVKTEPALSKILYGLTRFTIRVSRFQTVFIFVSLASLLVIAPGVVLGGYSSIHFWCR